MSATNVPPGPACFPISTHVCPHRRLLSRRLGLLPATTFSRRSAVGEDEGRRPVEVETSCGCGRCRLLASIALKTAALPTKWYLYPTTNNSVSDRPAVSWASERTRAREVKRQCALLCLLLFKNSEQCWQLFWFLSRHIDEIYSFPGLPGPHRQARPPDFWVGSFMSCGISTGACNALDV